MQVSHVPAPESGRTSAAFPISPSTQQPRRRRNQCFVRGACCDGSSRATMNKVHVASRLVRLSVDGHLCRSRDLSRGGPCLGWQGTERHYAHAIAQLDSSRRMAWRANCSAIGLMGSLIIIARQVSKHPGNNGWPVRPTGFPLRRVAQDANLVAYCQFGRTDSDHVYCLCIARLHRRLMTMSTDDVARFLLGSPGVDRKKLRPC